MTELLATLAPLATERYDIADPDDHRRVREMADRMLDVVANTEDNDKEDKKDNKATDVLREVGSDPDAPLDVRVATKVAQSKLALRRSGWTEPVAVTMAMWGEQRRLRPRSDDNPTGEDSLHVKLDQLSWLFDDGRRSGESIPWRLYAVDDGDPDDSAAVALERAADHAFGDRVTVLRLGEAIPAEAGPLAGLGHVDDSRKGGAIVHGAASATADGHAAVIMTDADNSVDLAQVGLLVAAHAGGAEVVIGDRKNPESVLVKAEARWGPGIVALRHMQRMVGRELFDRGIQDTQAAFKLYGRAALEPILAAPSTYGFSFDSDWLFGAIAAGHRIESVPFAFIDSFAESASIAQGPMTTWESLLRGLVAAARARGVDHHQDMAAVVDDLADAETLERVVSAVPEPLAGIDPAQLGDPTIMSPTQMREWITTLT